MKNNRLYAILAIFVGSFLVFGVQPMVGNTLLPFFGGTAAIWTVCLASFQCLLLAGYFYADRLSKVRLKNINFHTILLALAAIWIAFVSLKFRDIAGWAGEFNIPVLGALVAVLAMVGIPYILLSSNASLIQALSAKQAINQDRSVYKLYAISNAGSFCGLLFYPLIMEPFFGIAQQWMLFAFGIGLYAVLVSILIFISNRSGAIEAVGANLKTTDNDEEGIASKAEQIEWLLLSALSCFLLNGVSAHLCNDVTPLPLMWAVMLSLYLISWIFGFTDRGSKISAITSIVSIGLAIFAAWHVVYISGRGFFIELAVGCLIILLGCWTIHARLFRLRPNKKYLTRYYLYIAIGGAIGGTAASILLPMISTRVIEYQMALTFLLVPAICEIHFWLKHLDSSVQDLNRWYVLVAVVGFALYAWHFGSVTDGNVILTMRNFYGTGRVIKQQMEVIGGQGYEAHIFEHAGIQHGLQPTWRGLRSQPTLCFGEHAGGLAIKKHPKYIKGEPMRVAIAGMGVATLSTYAREGDYYRFYEINPQVAKLATNTNFFWYVADCKGELSIVVDDARRALEKERSRVEEKWDVIIIDVFAGDSIPPHMSTREAFALYLDRLAEGGTIAIHITNWHLALSPMVKAAAKAFNLHLQGYGCWADKWSIGSYWTFLTRERADFFMEGKHGRVDYAKIKDIPLMTDEMHSLLPYISMNPMPDFK